MNKEEITKAVQAKFPTAPVETKLLAEMITAAFDTMTEGAIRDGYAVFGKHKFKKVERAARTGYNFHLKTSVPIPSKIEIKYEPVGA